MELHTALEWAATRRLAALITLRSDGRPQSSDIVYGLVDGQFLITAGPDRAKTVNIRRDGRSVLHISDGVDRSSYVSLDGTAEVTGPATSTTDPVADGLVAYYEASKGEPHPDWDEFRQAMVDQGNILIAFTPASAVGFIR